MIRIFAVQINGGGGGGMSSPIANPVIPQFELGTLIGNLIGVAIIAAALMTFVYLFLGGLQWILSGGDKAGIEAARNRITHAFVGLFIVVASWAIMTLTANFFCFPFPEIIIPRLGEKTVGGRCKSVDTSQWCKDKFGKSGEKCDGNPNHCTLEGRCDLSCCANDDDCPKGSGQRCRGSNDNCKNGLFCY